MTQVAPTEVSSRGPTPSNDRPERTWPRWIRWPQQPMIRHLTLALCAAAILYFVTSALSPYDDFLVGEIALYLIALAGLSLLTGVNGQISLGQGAFMAVGAYTMALLMTHTKLNFTIELVAAIGAAAVLGLVIGIPATRLKGPYLAGMTLLLALALPPIADKWNGTFGGDQGLTTTVPTAPGTINSEQWLAWIEIAGALLTLVLLANLLRSRFGRSFRAVRDDEIAASLAGSACCPHEGDGICDQRWLRRFGRCIPGAVHRCSEHRGVPPHPFHPIAGRHGGRGDRQPHGHVVGCHLVGVPPPVVDLAFGPLQSRQWGQCVPRHHHLWRGTDCGDDGRTHRDPRRPSSGVGTRLETLVARLQCRAGPDNGPDNGVLEFPSC